MLVMTYSQARQNFSSFLDSAKKDGEAEVRRSDGSVFKVIPVEEEKKKDSPFANIKPVPLKHKISMQEIIDMMHEAQDERADRILAAANGKTAEAFFNVLSKD